MSAVRYFNRISCCESGNKLQAAAAAVCMMGYAGELAAEKSGQSGSGTYRVSLMDAVSCMDGDILERGARYEIR